MPYRTNEEVRLNTARLVSDLVWCVTDGGTKIDPKKLLSYQDEPIQELDDIIDYTRSSDLDAIIEGLPKIKREQNEQDYGYNLAVEEMNRYLMSLK